MLLAFLLISVFTTANCWSNDELMGVLEKACHPKNMICPRQQYAFFDGFLWEWDEEAIFNSDFAKKFQEYTDMGDDVYAAMRKEFCCLKGPCLFRCGIFPRQEIDLIKAFPANAFDLFKLNLPELEPHREFIMDYLTNPKPIRRKVFPAEVEEYFDAVHKHQSLIRRKLREQELQNI